MQQMHAMPTTMVGNLNSKDIGTKTTCYLTSKVSQPQLLVVLLCNSSLNNVDVDYDDERRMRLVLFQPQLADLPVPMNQLNRRHRF